MGNKLLFFFWYLSLWVKEKRKYSALWTGMPSNPNPEVEVRCLDAVCVPILEVCGRVISGHRWYKFLGATQLDTDHKYSVTFAWPMFVLFCRYVFLFVFSYCQGFAFLWTPLVRGRRSCWVQQVSSNSIVWCSLKLFGENNIPFSLLNANTTLAFENLCLLRYLAVICESWCCVEVDLNISVAAEHCVPIAMEKP